jgi:endonuclease YncB( thermonuclease family)
MFPFRAGAILVNYPVVLLFLFLSLLSGQAYAASFTGKLVKVLDGDTIEVLHNDKAERIRLAQIDCPEKGQPFGQAAKQYVLDIAALKIVTVQVDTVDRYGRTVGEVFLPDGANLNKQIVGAGYAWQYKQYSKDTAYADLEDQARRGSLGFWQDKDPVPPWEWRRGQRHAANVQTMGKDFTCGSKSYCKEMTTCAEAKFYLHECDLVGLDGDKDGVPCEALCR